MDESRSFAAWVSALEAADDDAVHRLWEEYFHKLTAIARGRLPEMRRRSFDEEDVALSALQSFCTGLEAGRFSRLNDAGNLWALLVLITHRKAAHRIRDETALKRGGGRVQGESVFGQSPDGIQGIITAEPDAEFAGLMLEELDHLQTVLSDDGLQQIALLRLQGFTNAEIARQLGCVERTIDRRLALIRKIWEESFDSDRSA